MAESSWPTTAGSRIVDDAQYEQLAHLWGRADGILGNPGDTTVCFGDSSGRQVKIRAQKRGHVRGRGWYSGASDNIIAIAANSSGSTRKDVVVLRLTRSTWAVTAAIVQGTPGAGNPALTQDGTGLTTGVWEIPLAVVTVANGAATITTSDVEQCIWYSHGPVIVLASTAPIQPAAWTYTHRRYSDTGEEWESVTAVWRRAPWQAAWGIIGGQQYTSGAAIVVGAGTTEGSLLLSSGAVTVRANRRYRVQGFVRVRQGSAPSGAVMVIKMRDTNISGTVRAERELPLTNTSSIFQHELQFEYIVGAADETKTWIITGFVSAGLWDAYYGTADKLVGVFVQDVGPAVPNVVTVIP